MQAGKLDRRRQVTVINRERTRVLAGYIKHLSNWPDVVKFHQHGNNLSSLRFRDGRQIRFVDASAEIWAFRSIWLEQCYTRAFGPLPRDGNVIDLGANIGLFSAFAAKFVVPDGRVLAVEPYPSCVSALEENVSYYSNVEICKAAVCGYGKLWTARDSLGGSIFSSGKGDLVTCESVSTEWILGYFATVDLLKANMEGAEYPFLLDSLDEWWRGVKRVALKWHDGKVARGHKPHELRRRLEALGFRVLRHQEIWREPDLITGITLAERRVAA